MATLLEEPRAMRDQLRVVGVEGGIERRQGRTPDAFCYPFAHPRHIDDRKNATFAGRSASLRMKYGYHCVPNGTARRKGWPRLTTSAWSLDLTPYNIWNSYDPSRTPVLRINSILCSMIAS